MSDEYREGALAAFRQQNPQIEASRLRSESVLTALLYIDLGMPIREAARKVGLKTHQDVAKWATRLQIGKRVPKRARPFRQAA